METKFVNVDSGLKDATGNKVALEDATGSTLNNAVNVGDLKDTIGNITNNGFGLTDEMVMMLKLNLVKL